MVASSMLNVEGFVVKQSSHGYQTRILAERELVLVERKPMKTRKARPSPLVNEQLLESLGDQFVTLTEPTLKVPELELSTSLSEPTDASRATLQKRVTKPSKAQSRKTSSQSMQASPGRKTPDFTSLKTRRKSKRSKKNGSSVPKFFNLSDGSNVSEYYFTKLLTRDEEYALGTKVQFLCKCYRVHEGLSLQLERIPTIVEWANACGFVDPEPTSPSVDEDELRPSGYRDMFEEVDPDEFVGNGLAADAGPGRGRGRRKKPAPTSLEDVYDDSEYQAQMRRREKDRTLPKPSKPTEPINRGSPSQFCTMLEESRVAKQRMMQTNMRLVVSIANKYRTGGVSFQDLVQEGSLGLHRAAEKFDPRKVSP